MVQFLSELAPQCEVVMKGSGFANMGGLWSPRCKDLQLLQDLDPWPGIERLQYIANNLAAENNLKWIWFDGVQELREKVCIQAAVCLFSKCTVLQKVMMWRNDLSSMTLAEIVQAMPSEVALEEINVGQNPFLFREDSSVGVQAIAQLLLKCPNLKKLEISADRELAGDE
eukprot:2609410-Karenia_brevis.AAC.1